MQKKYKGLLIFTKIHKENDLFIKFLSDTDEIITGIVYGGLSKKKKNILQPGFFLNFSVLNISSKPPSITIELVPPYISPIINDKYKINCLLSVISLLNISIIEGQKITKIYQSSEIFLKRLIDQKRWIIDYFRYLLNLLKIIGYEINYLENKKMTYFDLNNLNFTNLKSYTTIPFPHKLFNDNNKYIINQTEINNLFKIFETVYIQNHLSNINLYLPNHYQLFKKIIINYLKNK